MRLRQGYSPPSACSPDVSSLADLTAVFRNVEEMGESACYAAMSAPPAMAQTATARITLESGIILVRIRDGALQRPADARENLGVAAFPLATTAAAVAPVAAAIGQDESQP
jgi:hypothetical protein